MPDPRLVAKGKNEPLAGLVQEGRKHVELGKKHAEQLAKNGWSAADTKKVEDTAAELDTQSAAAADASNTARTLTAREQEAIDEAKAFIRKTRNALPRVLRENKDLGVSASSFESGTLDRSTPKISAYLGKIRPHVVTLDGPLAKYFDGAVASQRLDEVKTKLDSTDAQQETAIDSLPAETAQVYEKKGLLLELIEDMNRAGKSAFDGNAETAATFNKDILLRARRAARKPQPEKPKPAPAE